MSIGARALVLITVGVLANNYVYLHDVIWGRNPGLRSAARELQPEHSESIITLGWLGYLGVVITLAVILVGLYLARRTLGEAKQS